MTKIGVCILFAGVVSVFGETGRPNVLFVLTDDQRDNSFSGMGHEWVETPHIDTLLSKGMRFSKAYIAEPTCCPSRAAILLGCHERMNRNGFSSRHKMTASQWEDSYPELLRTAGYKTGYVGKWHVKLDNLNFENMFDFWDGHNGHGPFYFDQVTADGEVRKITTNRHHTDNALQFLREERGDGPFCLSVCFATPHGSKVKSMHTVTEPASKHAVLKDHPIYGGKYRDLDITYPQQQFIDPYAHIPREVMDQDKGRNKTYSYVYDPETGKEHHYRYYQMITEIDQMLGELVGELEAQGLADNTIIIYASDHGVLMGEYGMGGKGLLYDLSMKFPCFVYDPKAPQKYRGITSEELVSSLDLALTILDYAGVEPGPYMTGRSLKPLVRGEKMDVPWRKDLFLENLYLGRDTPHQEGVVDGEWKYIRCYKTHPRDYATKIGEHAGEPVFEMLFNLVDDPEEMNNRTNDPECKEKLAELRKRCDGDLAELLALRSRYAEHYQIK